MKLTRKQKDQILSRTFHFCVAYATQKECEEAFEVAYQGFRGMEIAVTRLRDAETGEECICVLSLHRETVERARAWGEWGGTRIFKLHEKNLLPLALRHIHMKLNAPLGGEYRLPRPLSGRRLRGDGKLDIGRG